MNSPPKHPSLLTLGFYAGLVGKALYGALECVNGVLLFVLSHERLNAVLSLLAFPELREDPSDRLMRALLRFGQTLSLSAQHTLALYLLLHGGAKIAVIWLMLQKKLWAFPLAMAVFGGFLAYEIAAFVQKGGGLLALTLLDGFVLLMIVLEYRHLKQTPAGA